MNVHTLVPNLLFLLLLLLILLLHLLPLPPPTLLQISGVIGSNLLSTICSLAFHKSLQCWKVPSVIPTDHFPQSYSQKKSKIQTKSTKEVRNTNRKYFKRAPNYSWPQNTFLAANNIFQFWKQFSSLFFPLQIMEHKNLHVDNFLQPIASWQKDRWDKPKTCVPLIFSIWRNDNQDLYSPEVTVIEQAWNIAPAHDVIPPRAIGPNICSFG